MRLGRNKFSRVEGYNLATRSWSCRQCNTFTSIQRPSCGYCGGTTFFYFQSAREARRYRELLLLQAGRVIRDLEVHPEFPLSVPMHDSTEVAEICKYIADFSYTEKDEFVVEDVKPSDPKAIDPLSRHRMRHFTVEYGIKIRIT